jgi:methyl-accepting chemotaxis protein
MKKSLRAKLTLGAMGLVVIVCLAITAVVSFISNRQNLQSVERDLGKALVIAQTELDGKKLNMSAEVNRMIVENKIGPTVKFLYDYLEDDLSITESTYYKIADIIMNKAMATRFLQIGVYDLQGNLQVFAQREDLDTYQFGFYKKPKIHMNIATQGEEFDEGAWKHTDQLGSVKIALNYNDPPPKEETVFLADRNGVLSLETLTPVFANEFNDDGDPVLKQFGFIHSVKELDDSFIDRLGLLTGMSVNVYSGKQLSLGQLETYKNIDSTSIESMQDKHNGSETKTVIAEVTLDSHRYFQATLPTYGLQGISGYVAILQSDDIVKNNTFQIIKMLSLVSLVCLAMVMPLVMLFSRSIIRPIIHLVDRMKDIAEGDGDLRGRITVTSQDEVGQLAESFNTFVEKIQTMIGEVKENLAHLNDSSSSLSDIASSLASGAGQSSEKANVVAAAGEEMSSNMNSIAASMEQAATNVSMVAENAKQMSVNIEDVIKNTDNAREISSEAVAQATKASQQVGELGNAASEIEKVIETITEISEQVNLLALNATIEAARAGEAGKGFAVVANEIKELANQTAAATNEIKQKVADIRNSTDGTVSEIETITSVNSQINQIIQLISEKVDEQSSATSDIAENVSQASMGIDEVNENVAQSSTVSAEIARDIVEVTLAAEETSKNSSLVNERATGLSELAAQLKRIVDRFQV